MGITGFHSRHRGEDEITKGTVICKVDFKKLKDAKLSLPKKEITKVMKAIESEDSDEEKEPKKKKEKEEKGEEVVPSLTESEGR